MLQVPEDRLFLINCKVKLKMPTNIIKHLNGSAKFIFTSKQKLQ